jgi:hypothetical protein
MQLHFFSFCPILGVAGVLALAGKVWQKQRVREDARRRRTIDNLRAALQD